MSTNSVYQQLRAHLAYLNLPAAAEALPTHLDQARQHDIGQTIYRPPWVPRQSQWNTRFAERAYRFRPTKVRFFW